ncbi:MAG: hypothetical protein JO220_02885 [Hyphomicrobiales bacterium]|nr:hypothetical protein [Hyphomicrobiales bacterium]
MAMLLARGGNKVLAVRMTGDRKVCPNCDSREKSFDADFSRTLADRGTAPLISR